MKLAFVSTRLPIVGVLILLVASVLTACTIHRIDVQQGNVITDEMVSQLETALKGPQEVNRRQVRFIMGTPMIEDPFHRDRWDYIFTLQPGDTRAITEYRRVTVFFDGDKALRIEKYAGEP